MKDHTRMKCQRPGCPKAAYRWGHGYCRPHSISEGAAVHRVDATPARLHALHCIRQGATANSIADQVGVSRTTVTKLARGEKKRLMPDIARRIMTATPRMADRQPAWPIRRRVQALRAAGWTIDELATHTGISASGIYSLCREGSRTVDGRTATAVRTFYRDHQDDPARPVNRRTAAHHWPLPAEWSNIDDPAEDPTVHRIAETLDHRELLTATIAIVGSATEVSQQTGVPACSISRAINHGSTLRWDYARAVRGLYCQLNSIPTPEVDPMRAPDHLRQAMRRYAEGAGLRWLPHIDPKDRCQIPGRSSAAETLGITPSLVDRIMGTGLITPAEYDQVCTALGINMEQAA